jgi:hypothetical protein
MENQLNNLRYKIIFYIQFKRHEVSCLIIYGHTEELMSVPNFKYQSGLKGKSEQLQVTFSCIEQSKVKHILCIFWGNEQKV